MPSDNIEVNAHFRARLKEGGSNGPASLQIAEWFRPSVAREPELALMEAVMIKALDDLAGNKIAQRIAAAQWIDNPSLHLYGFESICDAFDLPCDKVRKRLRALYPQAWLELKKLALPQKAMNTEHRRIARKQQRALAIDLLWDGWNDERVAKRCNLSIDQVQFLRRTRGIKDK
jgi:hypothetical protein